MKACLLRKRKGAGNVLVMLCIFVSFIAIYTVYNCSFRQAKYTKHEIDNGVILSALAADVVDQYQAATFNAILFDVITTNQDNAYGKLAKAGDTSLEEQFQQGSLIAWQIARERFLTALYKNLDMSAGSNGNYVTSMAGVSDIQIHEVVIYNVLGNDVYKCDGSAVTKYENARDTMREPTGKTINSSGIYVYMTCKVTTHLGTNTLPVSEYVGILEE